MDYNISISPFSVEEDDSEYLKFATFSLSNVLRECTPLLGSSGVEFEFQDVSNWGEGDISTVLSGSPSYSMICDLPKVRYFYVNCTH